ncbi:hypothetical protein Smic_22740 [Streptomyces microflavus]|uniref:Uncharacterized protein n=1 Tax=Streptomyces microflavus TaxID=1919 RepID=A0A7J0CN31_STRMI|nr:hypothetical protein Smic_22740 [Streptomyces microflavus]
MGTLKRLNELSSLRNALGGDSGPTLLADPLSEVQPVCRMRSPQRAYVASSFSLFEHAESVGRCR